MPDLDSAARALALEHIRSAVEAGQSEQYIRSTWHYSSAPARMGATNKPVEYGAYTVKIGGTVGDKWYPPSKVIVERVCSVEVNKVFSLHELYEECRKGQLSLL